MNLQNTGGGRALCLQAAAKRLRIPERTLRYRAKHGLIHGAFKQGKLWKFSLTALERQVLDGFSPDKEGAEGVTRR